MIRKEGLVPTQFLPGITNYVGPGYDFYVNIVLSRREGEEDKIMLLHTYIISMDVMP